MCLLGTWKKVSYYLLRKPIGVRFRVLTRLVDTQSNQHYHIVQYHDSQSGR